MTDSEKKALLGFGLLSLGVLLFMKRKTLSSVAQSALDSVNDAIFQAVIPSSAQPYSDVIKQVAQETGVDPFLIAALGDRETRWGSIRGLNGSTGPSIIGADGTGHGLMQIDSGTWGDWIAANDWADPYTNVKKGVEVFAGDLDFFSAKGLSGDDLTRAALAAYNHGPGNVWANIQAGRDPDAGSTGGNYSSDVFSRASTMVAAFLTSTGSPTTAVAGWWDAGAGGGPETV